MKPTLFWKTKGFTEEKSPKNGQKSRENRSEKPIFHRFHEIRWKDIDVSTPKPTIFRSKYDDFSSKSPHNLHRYFFANYVAGLKNLRSQRRGGLNFPYFDINSRLFEISFPTFAISVPVFLKSLFSKKFVT